MKFIAPVVLSESVKEVLEAWKGGELTDVIMTKEKICVYSKGELLHIESFSEDEMVSFVEETIPVKYEKEWGELITTGSVVKYSFGIRECCIARVYLWGDGLSMRFIPLNPLEVVKEEELAPVKQERFFHVERGGKCSGKTTRIFAQVVDYCARNKGSLVFTYERPQEIYVQEEVAQVITIHKEDVSIEEFADLVLSSGASLCVVQHAQKGDMEILKHLYKCGVNVLAEVRKPTGGSDEGGSQLRRDKL